MKSIKIDKKNLLWVTIVNNYGYETFCSMNFNFLTKGPILAKVNFTILLPQSADSEEISIGHQKEEIGATLCIKDVYTPYYLNKLACHFT